MISEDYMVEVLRSAIFTLEVLLYGGYDEQTRNSAIDVMEELKGVLEEMGEEA